jgi:hypothetical protein
MSAQDYEPIIQAAAKANNVDPALLRGIIATESSGKPNAQSGVGATGLMQIMPSNYKSLGITDPTDPQQNIFGGAKLLSQLLDRFPDVQTALTHYVGGDDPKQWSSQTAAYPRKVLTAAGIGAQAAPKASATLPGVPTAQAPAGPHDDDAIFASVSKGAVPTVAKAVPNNDDAIFAALSKQPGQPVQSSPPPATATAAPQGEQPGMLASFGAGLGRGVQETALGAQQLLGHGAQAVGLDGVGNWLVNDANQGLAHGAQEVSPYSAAHPVATGAGSMAGSIAATAPLGALAPITGTLGAAAAVGAGMGAVGGALSPVDPNSQNFASDKLKQMGIGAAGGAVLSPLAQIAGRIISPTVAPEVQQMLDNGVTPTPGQILGGAAARTEEKLTSVPVVGDMIKNAQQRAVQQFNRATYQDALEPIGGQIPANIATGSDAVGYVNRQIGNVYRSIEPRANFTADANFSNDLAQIRADLSQNAPGALAQFDNIVQHQIAGKLTGGAPAAQGGLPMGGTMTGAQWGNTRSAISGVARQRVIGNATPDDRVLAGALGDLNDAVNAAVGRSSPPDVIPTLQNANTAWSRYKQIESAAGSTGASNNGNVFSPAQYNAAIRKGSTNAQRAQNSGQNADLGAAAQQVLGSKYPDSGTVGRGLMSLLAPGSIAAGLATQPGTTLATLAGIGAGSLPYTALGQRATAALLTARPQFAQPVGNAVSNLGRFVIPGSLAPLLAGGSR